MINESAYRPIGKKIGLLEAYLSQIWKIIPSVNVYNVIRDKRSPKMSKLKKKQKIKKKKMKKKKQKEPSPRQIKHYRRIRESREERRRILHKKLKEKRRLRHKKLGTGPYNKTIIDYYGVYFDSPSIQLNDSLYDSIYDSSAINTDEIYDERMKEYPDSGLSSFSDYDIENYDKYGSKSAKEGDPEATSLDKSSPNEEENKSASKK